MAKIRGWLAVWLGTVVIAKSSKAVAAEIPPAQGSVAKINAQILRGFRAGSTNLLRDTQLRLQHLVREPDPAEPGHDFDCIATSQDAAQDRLEQTYRWGTLACVYTPVTNGLDLAVTLHNTSPRPLQAAYFDVLQLHFPSVPEGVPWRDRWTILRGGSDSEEPPVIAARWSDGSLALFKETVPQEMVFGFRPDFPTGNHALVVRRETPLAASESATVQLHLRVGPADAPLRQLAASAYDAFAERHPGQVHWPDRRPIATVFFASSVAGYPHNPRGWLLDPKLDTKTDAGRVRFREAILRCTDEVVSNANRLQAQGVIVWDIEGQEMRHPISYLGDPRVLPQAAPEMDAIADEVFTRLRRAGLRTGVTIRPTRPVWKTGIAPGWEQTVVTDPLTELHAKIAYARKRWGCALFYVDSNVEDRQVEGQIQTCTLSAKLFEQLARQNPDVLLMPEHQTVQYWATTAPYKEYPQGYTSTPEEVRAVYPEAFTVLRVVDGPPLEAHWSELVRAVAGGDILLFRAWWNDPVNDQVKRLYEEAAALHRR